MTAPDLEHRTPNCTGRWVRGERQPTVWSCTRCGALYLDSAEVALAAVRENAMDALLHALPRL